MLVVTDSALVCCAHVMGIVGIVPGQSPIPGQSFVFIDGRAVVVQTQPIGRPIAGCPNVGMTIKPCTAVVNVTGGWSDLVFVDGKAVCLDTLTGLTDGTPPGTVKYTVKHAGQGFVCQK